MKTYKFKCPHCGGEEFDCIMPVLNRFKTCTRMRETEGTSDLEMTDEDFSESDDWSYWPQGQPSQIECYKCGEAWENFAAAKKAGAFTEEGGSHE